jgi:hypothetical protein
MVDVVAWMALSFTDRIEIGTIRTDWLVSIRLLIVDDTSGR